MSSDPTFYTLSEQNFNIAAGESATVDVTFVHDPDALGEHLAGLILVAQNAKIAPQMVYLSAYITYDEAWTEDFEPEFEVEEGETVELPKGWDTTGWLIVKGGGMDMMAMMGMGSGEKSWAPHTDSDSYELISPRLLAGAGDVLRFYADVSSGWLNLEYKLDEETEWSRVNTYITADSIYFIAPKGGIYQLRFTGSSVAVDEFIGFLTPLEDINGDGLLDDDDVDAISEHIMGDTPDNFNEENADVNGDGKIDIADIVAFNKKRKLLDEDQ